MQSSLITAIAAVCILCLITAQSQNIAFSDETCGQDHLTIFVIGDWGIGGYDGYQSSSRRRLSDAAIEEEEEEDRKLAQNKVYYQHKTAASMAAHASKYCKPDAVFALGDNFYKKGVATPTDSMWTTHFSKVYQQYEVLQVPFYSVPGNHDYGQGFDAVQYAQGPARGAIDPLWKTKGTNYSVLMEIPGGGLFAGVFADTTTLSPATNAWTNENSGISTDEQNRRIVNQASHLWQFYTQVLDEEPQWLLTFGHYPIFSCGDHGDNSYLQQNLWNYIKHFGSQAYVCGHDHINMHLQYEQTEFFVAGAAAMNDYVKQSSTATMKWAGEAFSAFMVMQIYERQIIYSYINNNNTLVYQYTATNFMNGDSLKHHPTSQTSQPSHEPTFEPTAEPSFESSIAEGGDWRESIAEFASSKVKMAGAFGFIFVLLLVFVYKRRLMTLRDKKALKVTPWGDRYELPDTNDSLSFVPYDSRTSYLTSNTAYTMSGEVYDSETGEFTDTNLSPREKLSRALEDPAISAILGVASPRSRSSTVSSGCPSSSPVYNVETVYTSASDSTTERRRHVRPLEPFSFSYFNGLMARDIDKINSYQHRRSKTLPL